MKLTFPHIVAYIAGPLAFVAHLDPGLVTALVGPSAGPFVTPSIIAAGALLTFFHDIGVIPSKPAPTITSVAKAFPLVLAMAVAGGALAGCSALAKLSSPSAQTYVTDAVDSAVLGAEIAGVSGAEINRISKLALAADQGTAATLSTVANVINAELASLKLTDPELTAVSVLEKKLAAALQAQIDKNPNVASTQAVVADMLHEAILITGG
jgi:hypothetical protein